MTPDIAPPYPFEEWLSEVEAMEYSDYWNDESQEQQKAFWILDGDFRKMEQYIAETGLVEQLEASVRAARERFGRALQGVGCDLAAGALWAVPHLLRLGRVGKIYCVEYSRHRLLKLGPAVLAHYRVPAEKIVLALGDFHRLSLPDAALDFVFMSAAFHHSNAPARLLQELRRVLKPDGVVLIIGEHVADLRWEHYLTQPLKFLVSRCVPDGIQRRLLGRSLKTRRFLPDPQEVFAADEELGDHAYTLDEYHALFATAGFQSADLRERNAPLQAFVLVPQ